MMAKKRKLRNAVKSEHSRYLLMRTVALQQGQKAAQLEAENAALKAERNRIPDMQCPLCYAETAYYDGYHCTECDWSQHTSDTNPLTPDQAIAALRQQLAALQTPAQAKGFRPIRDWSPESRKQLYSLMDKDGQTLEDLQNVEFVFRYKVNFVGDWTPEEMKTDRQKLSIEWHEPTQADALGDMLDDAFGDGNKTE